MSERNPQELQQFHKGKRMIYALLEEYLHCGDERCTYDPGWSDQTIYDAVLEAYPEGRLKSTNVTNIRTGAWGLISTPKVKAHSTQIADLSKMVATQAEQIKVLTNLMSKSVPAVEGSPSIHSLFRGSKDCV